MSFATFSEILRSEILCKTETEANEALLVQPRIWTDVLKTLQNALLLTADVQASQMVEELIPILLEPGVFVRQHDPDRSVFVVTGKLPPIVSATPQAITAIQNHPHDCLAVILYEASDVITLINWGTKRPDRFYPIFSPPTQLSLMRYVYYRSMKDLSRTTERLAEAKITSGMQTLEAYIARMSELTQQANAAKNMFFQAHMQHEEEWIRERAEQLAAINKFRNQTEGEWRGFLEEARREIEAARALAHESRALTGARKVWTNKYRRHRWTFGLGLIGLSCLIGGGLAALMIWWNDFVAAIPRSAATGEITPSALLLLVIPMVAVAWILRIIVRWVTNAMALGEDAQQRHAMLETYFQLVGDPEAKMEQSDRILILNAIFRPLPGHQSEDVAPPTLLDLTKQALTPGKP